MDIEGLRVGLVNFSSKIEKKFKEVEKSIDSLSKKIELNIDNVLDGNSKQLSNISSVEKYLKNIDDRLRRIENKVNKLNKK